MYMLRLLNKYRGRNRSIIPGEFWWVNCRPGGVYWARRNADRIEIPREGACENLDAVPVPRGERVVFCIPGEFVRTHYVHIPTGNRKRFLAALPYALEDQLLHAPESYHFAPLPKEKGLDVTPVAVIGHDKLRDWLQIATDRGWKLLAVFPEYLALPQPDQNTWYLDVTASPLLLRTSACTGAAFAVAGNNQLPGPLRLALEQAPRHPKVLRVRISSNEQSESLRTWQIALSSMAIELDVIVSDSPREKLLALNELPAIACILLTGRHAVRVERTWRFAQLAPAAGLTGALAMALAAQAIISHNRVKTEHQRLQQEIEDVYMTVFPDARNLIDPRYQMERRLQEMRARERDPVLQNEFFSILKHVAPALLNNGKLEIMTLEFNGQELALEISAPDFESLSSLQSVLSGKFRVDIENADPQAGRVLGRLRIGGRA